MRTYNIDLKYINSHEGFVIAVLACIYEEIKVLIRYKKATCGDNDEVLTYTNKLRVAMDRVLKSYKMVFKINKDPIKTFTENSDTLEMIENSTAMIKLQENVDNLLHYFDNKSVCINIKGDLTNEKYKGELIPELYDKIIFKLLDLK